MLHVESSFILCDRFNIIYSCNEKDYYYSYVRYHLNFTVQALMQLKEIFTGGYHYRQARFMAIIDALNTIYGHNTLLFAIQGMTRSWKMRQLKLTNRFTS